MPGVGHPSPGWWGAMERSEQVGDPRDLYLGEAQAVCSVVSDRGWKTVRD